MRYGEQNYIIGGEHTSHVVCEQDVEGLKQREPSQHCRAIR